MPNDGIEPEERAKIIRLIKAVIPSAEIYLYGSRARGTYRHGSDVDIALGGKGITRYNAGEVRTVLEGSRLPYIFDVVALDAIGEEFNNIIKNEMVLWSK
ncbi:nucleotidyltransferase domain-containing protein [Candidatus Dependentiae bacterium]|nr:nucleotidyltransferase domain-containing protein [Candidatus Dependentiae bacterium]